MTSGNRDGEDGQPPVEGRRVGRYEIIRQIGRGGMAIVYLARQETLDREVALKELGTFQASDPQMAQRFLRESQLAGSLNHPNIVTVLEYFEEGGIPYIAMEYVRRGSLRPYVGRLSLAQFVGVMEGVLAGLAHAETYGIVHRDLKPENLMVTVDGRVKITDFGIAKATQSIGGAFLTAVGTTVGTPSYMAPEQAMGRDIGPWTDLYSVGIMAWENVVGHVPFHDSDAPMVILTRQLNEEIPPTVTVRPDADPDVSAWIDRLLVKRHSERARSPIEVWDELEEIVIQKLGPRWRREARLPSPSEVINLPDHPLTPAPFESQRMRTPEPSTRGGVKAPTQPDWEYLTYGRVAEEAAPASAEAVEAKTPTPVPSRVQEPPAPAPESERVASSELEALPAGLDMSAAEASAVADAPAEEALASEAASAAAEAPAAEPAPAAAEASPTPDVTPVPADAQAAPAAPQESRDPTYITFGRAPEAAVAAGPAAPEEHAPAEVEAADEVPAAEVIPMPGRRVSEAMPLPEVDTAPTEAEVAPPTEPAEAETEPVHAAEPGGAEAEFAAAEAAEPEAIPGEAAPVEAVRAEAAPVEATRAEAAPAEAARAEPTEAEPAPPPVVSPAAAAEEAPARRGRAIPIRRGAVAAVLVGVAAAAAIGFLVAPKSGSSTAPQSPLVGSVSNGPIGVSFPAGWQRQGAIAAPGLKLANEIVIAPTNPSGGTLVIGTAKTTGPSLLPASLLSALTSTPTPQTVTLGHAQFYRYLDLTPRGASAPESVYALPTTVGTVIASCLLHGAGTAFPGGCERVIGTLQLSSGSVLGLGPNQTFGSQLSSTITKLNTAVSAGQSRLQKAGKPGDQASAAQQLSAAYTQAAASTSKLQPSPAAISAAAALTAALRRTGQDYSGLAAAASHDDGRGYAAAQGSIAQDSTAVTAALSRLASAGYPSG